MNNSFNNIKDAIDFSKDSKKCLADGNFILHKWATNCDKLRDFINTQSHPSEVQNTEDQTYVKTEFRASEKYRKVLEINWETNTDSFVIEFDSLVEDTYYETVTKRNILKFSVPLFDPLRLTSPFILPSKVLFQKLCKDKIHWDSPVSESVKEQWIKYFNNLKTIKSVVIERHLFCCEASEKELHGFCDSFGIAYSAVVFVRSVCEHGVKVRLWYAKTRLVPFKEGDMPRLELLGCLLLSKLIKSVCEAVGRVARLSEIYCWSDAQISL